MQNINLFRISIKENLIKNGFIILLIFLSYPFIYKSIQSLDSAKIGDFLVVLSMLLVTVCFANFSFTYEKTIMAKYRMRMLSHISTFIFMLLIALLLEVLVISIGIVYSSLYFVILIFSTMLYAGIALYDFWDFFRAFQKK